MTPKEKAKHLMFLFANKIQKYDTILYQKKLSKKCALIAVDELLSETEEFDGMRVINNPYWLEVKQEIEKL